MYKIEENLLGKVCPKITKNHIFLSNLSKMKVKYATQVIQFHIYNKYMYSKLLY